MGPEGVQFELRNVDDDVRADGPDALAAGRVEGGAAEERAAVDGGDAFGQGDGLEGEAAIEGGCLNGCEFGRMDLRAKQP